MLELARGEWIEQRRNVIALGPSGTGKTHAALALGLAACQKGLSVAFTNSSGAPAAPTKTHAGAARRWSA